MKLAGRFLLIHTTIPICCKRKKKPAVHINAQVTCVTFRLNDLLETVDRYSRLS